MVKAKPPTYRELYDACAAEFVNRTAGNHALYGEVDYLIEQGRENAHATVYVEKEHPPAQWESIFRGTIGTLLAMGGYSDEVCDWFTSHGVTF